MNALLDFTLWMPITSLKKEDNHKANPYLKIHLGSTEINEKKDYIKDTSTPEWYKCYEIPTSLPGASQLQIQIWDHENFLHDEMIGETMIDLEDRFYSRKWRSLKDYPIETRKLFHPSSKLPQGELRMWVEIMPKDNPIFKKVKRNISPKPPADYEVRVIVWECEGVPRVNKLTDTVDIYISAKINNDHEVRTDTHFRSTSGKGSFNWRALFPVTLPHHENRITFQIWDKELLTTNDYISEATLDFNFEAESAFTTDRTVKVYAKDSKNNEKFWIKCEKSKGAKLEDCGKILVSFEIVPKELATLCPVGHGRSSPNQNPFLPPPIGRIHWSWNPFTLIGEMLGPGAKRKLMLFCCCMIWTALLIVSIPTIMGDLFTKMIP